MIRTSRVLLGTALVIGLALAIAITVTPTGLRPLDLPIADAQAAPGIVQFYGHTYDGDSFVWCLDTSGSMGWAGDLAPMVVAVQDALGQLSPSQEFSIIGFSSSFVVYSSTLLPATGANIAAGQLWLNALVAQGATCALQALVNSLGLLQGATGSRALLVVSDGEPNCPGPAETLLGVLAANFLQIPIHTFQIPGSSQATGSFLEALAAQNGGTYLDLGVPVDQIRRGDVDGDGSQNIADAIVLLAVTFSGSPQTICEDAADVNDDGALQGIPDAIYLLSYLFAAGSTAPPPPYPSCGVDPTVDALTCDALSCP